LAINNNDDKSDYNIIIMPYVLFEVTKSNIVRERFSCPEIEGENNVCCMHRPPASRKPVIDKEFQRRSLSNQSFEERVANTREWFFRAQEHLFNKDLSNLSQQYSM